MDEANLQQLISLLSSLSQQLQLVTGGPILTDCPNRAAPIPAATVHGQPPLSFGDASTTSATSSEIRRPTTTTSTSAASTTPLIRTSTDFIDNTDTVVNINSLREFPPLLAPSCNTTSARPTHTQTTSHDTHTPTNTHKPLPLLDIEFTPVHVVVFLLRQNSRQAPLWGRAEGILGRALLQPIM